ncbi:MAG: hypothetical protein GEU80_09015 [Dehalococcoidia bacterium]|nr:hypothetical protein [Dehalococcoidia bacterium]
MPDRPFATQSAVSSAPTPLDTIEHAQPVYDVPPEDEPAYLRRSYEAYVGEYNSLVREFWDLASRGELDAAHHLRERIEGFWPHPSTLADSPWVPADARRLRPLPAPGDR